MAAYVLSPDRIKKEHSQRDTFFDASPNPQKVRYVHLSTVHSHVLKVTLSLLFYRKVSPHTLYLSIPSIKCIRDQTLQLHTVVVWNKLCSKGQYMKNVRH